MERHNGQNYVTNYVNISRYVATKMLPHNDIELVKSPYVAVLTPPHNDQDRTLPHNDRQNRLNSQVIMRQLSPHKDLKRCHYAAAIAT